MSLKIVDVGLPKMLDKLLTAYGNTLQLCLFTNNYTPAAGDTLANYTEATFPGYARQAVSNWIPSTVAASVATSNADQKQFQRNATGTGQAVYGYFVLDGAGALLFAERDPAAPITLTNQGDTYLITPKFTYQSLF
jgi:hypothetical protein